MAIRCYVCDNLAVRIETPGDRVFLFACRDSEHIGVYVDEVYEDDIVRGGNDER